MEGQFSSQRSVIRYFCTANLVKGSERVGFPRRFSSLFLRLKETNAVLSRKRPMRFFLANRSLPVPDLEEDV